MVTWFQDDSAGVALADGRVLVAGGGREVCDSTGEYCYFVDTNATEIFTP